MEIVTCSQCNKKHTFFVQLKKKNAKMSAKPRWFCSEECCVEFLKLNKDWLNFDILTSMSKSDEKVFIDHVLENINKT